GGGDADDAERSSGGHVPGRRQVLPRELHDVAEDAEGGEGQAQRQEESAREAPRGGNRWSGHAGIVVTGRRKLHVSRPGERLRFVIDAFALVRICPPPMCNGVPTLLPARSGGQRQARPEALSAARGGLAPGPAAAGPAAARPQPERPPRAGRRPRVIRCDLQRKRVVIAATKGVLMRVRRCCWLLVVLVLPACKGRVESTSAPDRPPEAPAVAAGAASPPPAKAAGGRCTTPSASRRTSRTP